MKVESTNWRKAPKWIREWIKFYDLDRSSIKMEISTPVRIKERRSGALTEELEHTGEVFVSMSGIRKRRPKKKKKKKTRGKRGS